MSENNIRQEQTRQDIHIEENKVSQEAALGDLEPRAEIKGGSVHKVTDVTLKRGIIG